MRGRKTVLTTGDVARICQVAPRTVSKWFDSGQLKGYRVPGSKDRRIPVEDLIRFMRAHGIPLGELKTTATRILIVEPDEELARSMVAALEEHDQCEAVSAPSAFAAGMAAARTNPQAVVINVDAVDMDASTVRDVLGAASSAARLIAVTSGGASPDAVRREGFDGCLAKPFHVKDVLRLVESLGINGA